jgi:hypothetical protein
MSETNREAETNGSAQPELYSSDRRRRWTGKEWLSTEDGSAEVADDSCRLTDY